MTIGIGIAISREEFMASIEQDLTLTPNPSSTKGPPSAIAVHLNHPASKETKKDQLGEAGGDNFDDIFGSLNSSNSKKPKKKKRKKGRDEFDDIFGGL